MNQKNNGRNYKRNTFLALAPRGQVLLLEGLWTHHNDINVVINYLKAWAPRADDPARTYPHDQITNHVNLLVSEVEQWVDIDAMPDNTPMILTAKPYIYGHDGEQRGGIRLVSLRGIPGIFRKSQMDLREQLGQIPRNEYFDWLTYQDGRYAWVGLKKWRNGHLLTRREIKAEKEKRAKKERKKRGLPVTRKDHRMQQNHQKHMDTLTRNANRH
ncbi:MAG: hypothetical protein LKE51_05690 [Selenomonas sp.]|jgi:hypothetical protein|nr:hypothetical protein [Selenomonas sp.]